MNFFSRWDPGYHRASSQSLLSHDGIMAITEPFTNFSFSRWNFGYHGAFHELFFLTMEFRLSRRLSQTFLSHNGISAITEPFTNFSFSRWNFGYHGAFLWNLGYHGAFLKLSRILSHGIHKTHNLGEDSFHIYHKEYLHRIHLIKNLAS
jgi:hypothetical protein